MFRKLAFNTHEVGFIMANIKSFFKNSSKCLCNQMKVEMVAENNLMTKFEMIHPWCDVMRCDVIQHEELESDSEGRGPGIIDKFCRSLVGS